MIFIGFRKLLKTKKGKTLLIIFILLALYLILGIYNDSKAFYFPKYQRKDISALLKKENISNDDYDMIFKQTGVSPYSSKKLMENGEEEKILKLNEMYFKKPNYSKSYIAFPVTANEINDDIITPVVDLKKGDVLITFNTHTLNWRHGHCAIVVDDEGKRTLEHMSIGKKSKTTYAKGWGIYPGFMVLRYKDEDISSKAADYAMEKLVGIDYNMFAGLCEKDKSGNITVDNSHCSHIVWQAFKANGADIDSDGGKLVTPYDIAQCDDFYVVQIYGINPEDYAERVLK